MTETEPITLLIAQLAYEGDEGPERAYRFERLGKKSSKSRWGLPAVYVISVESWSAKPGRTSWTGKHYGKHVRGLSCRKRAGGNPRRSI